MRHAADSKKTDPVKIVKDFFISRDFQEKKLLLGYSGGGDSQSLLYILLELQQELGLHLHLAHIDHGWREESAREADQLKALAQSLHIPIYVKKLEKNNLSNAESWARQQRYKFFAKLYKQLDIDFLVLAHHADDVAETFMQRVVEGADLPYLGGIQPSSQFKNMKISRPLLSIHKKDLLLWLQERNIPYFQDSTNFDPKFLRANMRVNIFPFLQKKYSKNIAKNLLIGAMRSFELKNYLDRKIAPYISAITKSPLGCYIDLSPYFPLEKVELRHFFKYLCAQYQIFLSREMTDLVIDCLQSHASDKMIPLKQGFLYCDKMRVFLCNHALAPIKTVLPLHKGVFSHEGWKVEVTDANKEGSQGWESLWKGEVVSCLIPHKQCFLTKYKEGMRLGSQRLKKIWHESQIPAFLRKVTPVIVDENGVVQELLSSPKKQKRNRTGLKILLQIDSVYYN